MPTSIAVAASIVAALVAKVGAIVGGLYDTAVYDTDVYAG